MIASISNIVVRKDLYDAGITTVEKLADYKRPDGAKPIVAATAIGSGTWMYGTYVFESKKLGDRINWVAGGGPKTMFPGLETKQFDAIMAVPGWVIEAEAQGLRQGHLRHLQAGRVRGGVRRHRAGARRLHAGGDRSSEQKALVQAFVNAMVQGDEVGEGDADRRGLSRSSPTSTSPASIPVAVKAEMEFDKKTWAYDGRIDKASWERGGKVWYRKGSDIPESSYDDLVDMSFLETALAKFS